MIPPEKLRFRARGTAMVQNHEQLEAGVNAFVGRRFGPVAGKPGRYGFAPNGETEEVPYRAEYVKACADGDLWAADDETAKHCDHYAKAHKLPTVAFDPKFGAAAGGTPALATTTAPAVAPEKA